jgi:hypothetical protein
MAFARTIIEEPIAEQELAELHRAYPRFEAFWLGWSWRLARRPDLNAVKVPGSDPPSFMVKSGDLTPYGLPAAVTILYRYTDDEVIVQGVRILQ